MNLIRRALPPVIFMFAVFLAAEFSYRVYALGPAGLSPAAMNSMTTLLQSGLVQPAAQHDVWFELPPNLDTRLGGAPLQTNSTGLVDRDYSIPKPPGIYRVAVLGSSWTMASGVSRDEPWHAVIESRLEASEGQPVQLINFALETYGLAEIAGTLRHKAMAYDPDLILLSITINTAYFKPPEPDEAFSQPPVRRPFTESLLLSTLADQLGVQLYTKFQRPGLGDELPGIERLDATGKHLKKSIRDIHAFTQARQVPLALVWLGPLALDQNRRKWLDELIADLEIPIYDGSAPLLDLKREITWGESRFRPEFRVSRFNNHPNAAGHGLIADKLQAELTRDGLLPNK